MPERLLPRSDITERGLGRFLHDIAEMAGEGQLTLALHHRGFDVEHIAAAFGPGQAGRDADFIFFEFRFGHDISARPDICADWSGRWCDICVFAFGDFLRHFAHDVGDLALEISHPGFTRVVRDYLADRRIGDLDVFLGDPMLVHLPGNEIFLGDAEFFFFRVPGNLDDFHPIPQGGENRIHQIRRRDEHDFRQIERHARDSGR